MASHEELRAVRLQKKDILLSKGIAVYPSDSHRTHEVQTLINEFESLSAKGEKVIINGRIMSKRGQGAILFVDVFDGSAKIQVVFKKDNPISYIDNSSVEECFDLFKEIADTGDFVEISGVLFVTQSGQQSIEVDGWRMLSKSLLPIPDSWYGLEDEDTKLRKRYLDILLNPELQELFKQKSLFWKTARRFFEDKGFLEVETPTLEVTTGGAEARPFATHHNDFDIDVFLRISVGELWQKRLMTAGFPKTFELGRVYRNEGSSTEHVQEFTNLECYAAYMNIEDGKKLVQDLYQTLAQTVFGKTEFTTRGHTFDLAGQWDEIDYVEEVKKHTGVDVLESSEKEMEQALHSLGVKFDGKNRERMTDALWKYCRKKISGPAFLINHPKVVAPLSKELSTDNRKTEMFQVIIAGSEIGRAHAELNDPVDQAARFDIQNKLITEGDEEAMMSDTEFVEAMEYGMPPIFGFGFGERLFTFFADRPIREVQLFPLMKPKE
ncbi:MAG: lysyl-tRNA synthetase [Candidatus Parcubacteria bacterium]|jgi:lysyl-tRNA synthetase class 2